MSLNPSPSQLDTNALNQRAFDGANDAYRTVLESTLDISLTAASGDSILAVGTEDGTLTGTQHVLEIDSNKNLHVLNMGQLVPKVFDAISTTYPTTSQEVYSYFTGGLSGTLVATVTVNYTDSTKAVFLNVART